MNKEVEDTIKGLQENQKTAIKLLEENVELKRNAKKAFELLEKIEPHDFYEYSSYCIYAQSMIILKKLIEGDKKE